MAMPNAYAPETEPPLEPGDRLSREEFERRYERMPELTKAELVEGIVYMPEYLAWINVEKRLLWWQLQDGEYREILPADALLKSGVFPGLWLDVAALLA
jgi:hypothetical protein